MASAEVQASVLYVEPTTDKPYSYEYDPPAGTPRRSAIYNEHRVSIRDARTLQHPAALDRQGFELVKHTTGVEDFYDEHQVRSIYYPELIRLVKEVTGATAAVVFDHTIRGSKIPVADGLVKEPVARVHNDYTPDSAVRRVRDIVSADRVEEVLRHRFLEVNVWRPIRGPLQTKPLAILDARSAANEDFIATDLIYRERRGEIYYVAHRPEHAWYYFPDMVREEALLIKGFDSDAQRARFAAHAAFEHPDTSADALPRESIEARIFAFFAPEKKTRLSEFLVQFR